MATLEPGSDLWWLSRLSTALAHRSKHVRCMNDWRDGNPPLPYPDNDDDARPAFERLQRVARINIAGLIVNARLSRMQLAGVTTALDDSANGDDMIATIIQEQDLHAKLGSAFEDMLTSGIGYLVATSSGVMYSSPLNTITEQDQHGKTVAALTTYYDAYTNENVMLLARPGYTREARSNGTSGMVLPNYIVATDLNDYTHMPVRWAFRTTDWELGEPTRTGLDTVPVYSFEYGNGLIAKHLPGLERLNHRVLQGLIIVAFQSFRARAITGVPVADDNGNPIDYNELFQSAPDSLMLLPDGASIWESSQADLTPLSSAIKDDIRILAVQSETPLFMISPDDANGSAEGATAQREILIFNIERITRAITGNIKQLFSDLLTMQGETERANPQKMRVLWLNPRRSSISERAAAAQQATNAGVPFRMMLEKFAEFTPDEVEAAIRERATEQLYASLNTGDQPTSPDWATTEPAEEETLDTSEPDEAL